MTRIARLPSLASAAALALLSVSCGGAVRERLLLQWTFAGQPCSIAGVATVRVFIAGQALSPDTFQCSQPGGATLTGADLGTFLTGTYALEVDGYDGAGVLLYQALQDIRVTQTGDNRIAIDLAAVAQTAVTLRWTFAGRTCAQAGNPTVQVFLDNSATPLADVTGNTNLPCAQRTSTGAFQDGISVYPLDPGQHLFTLIASGSGATYELRNYPVVTVYGQNVVVSPDLPAAGGCSAGACAAVLWSFSGLPCASAGVDTVRIFVDGVSAGDVACGNAGGSVTNIGAGSHTVAIVGFRAGTAEYQSGNVSANFALGATTFVPVDAPALPPAVGNASLAFQFPTGGPNCAGPGVTPISYTLTDPSGVQRAAAQAACGGGSTGLVFCDPRVSACAAGSQPGLQPGLWSVSASTQNTPGHVYTANYSFSVANVAQSQYTLQFQ